MAQPKLCYTMAMDGVLPNFFSQVDETGNLKDGIKFAGATMIVIATFVPFSMLDDLISSGILVAFTMTDASVILVRQTSPQNNPHLLEELLAVFIILSILCGFLLQNCLAIGITGYAVRIMTVLSCFSAFFVGNRIRTQCPTRRSLMQWHSNEPKSDLFLTPFVPILPLAGCFVSLS